MRRAVPIVVALLLMGAPVARAWTWPTGGSVVRPFAFDPNSPYAGGQHRGADLGGSLGETVLAPASGTVTFAGSVPSSGLTVTITTPDGYAVTLVHLAAIAVARGAAVAEGAPVGTLGASNETAEPSVHLGIRIASSPQGYLDPLSLLPPRPILPVVPAPSPAPAPAPAPGPASGPAETPAPPATNPVEPPSPPADPPAAVAAPDPTPASEPSPDAPPSDATEEAPAQPAEATAPSSQTPTPSTEAPAPQAEADSTVSPTADGGAAPTDPAAGDQPEANPAPAAGPAAPPEPAGVSISDAATAVSTPVAPPSGAASPTDLPDPTASVQAAEATQAVDTPPAAQPSALPGLPESVEAPAATPAVAAEPPLPLIEPATLASDSHVQAAVPALPDFTYSAVLTLLRDNAGKFVSAVTPRAPVVAAAPTRRRSSLARAAGPARSQRFHPAPAHEPARHRVVPVPVGLGGPTLEAAPARRTAPPFLLLGLAGLACTAAAAVGARIMGRSERRASAAEEDPGRGGVAVCERPASYRPRSGLRGPRGYRSPAITGCGGTTC